MNSTVKLFGFHQVAQGRFSLQGELTFRSAQSALQQARNLFRERRPMIFDFGGITRADSAGVAIMLTWLREAAEQGSSLKFDNLPEQLIAVAHVAGVDGMLRRD